MGVTDMDYRLRRLVAASGIIKLATGAVLALAWVIRQLPKKKGRR